MPNRIIREGMLTSRRVDKIFGMTELFYRRLQQIVDDFGRFEADPTLIRSKAFPKRINQIKEHQIEKWISQCQAANLLKVYSVKSIKYLELEDFRQRHRSESRYPSPNDGQMTDIGQSGDSQMSALGVGVGVGVVAIAAAPPEAARETLFDQFWKTYPKKRGKGKAQESWKRLKPSPSLLEQMLSTLRWQSATGEWQRESGRFIPNPATWLNQKRWLDEPTDLKHSAVIKGSDGKDYDVPEVSL